MGGWGGEVTRDPLLPVRLVDGVWISAEPAFATPIADDPFTPTPPSTGARNFPCDPYPPPFVGMVSIASSQAADATERQPGIMAPMTWPTPAPKATGSVDCSLSLSSSEAQFWAAITDEQRTIFAAVALDGSGVWAIGDTEADARADAIDRREYLRDCARSVDLDFPPLETDAAWLDTLAIVTLSGTTESLRAIAAALDDVIPWCPADLWDSGEVSP